MCYAIGIIGVLALMAIGRSNGMDSDMLILFLVGIGGVTLICGEKKGKG